MKKHFMNTKFIVIMNWKVLNFSISSSLHPIIKETLKFHRKTRWQVYNNYARAALTYHLSLGYDEERQFKCHTSWRRQARTTFLHISVLRLEYWHGDYLKSFALEQNELNDIYELTTLYLNVRR